MKDGATSWLLPLDFRNHGEKEEEEAIIAYWELIDWKDGGKHMFP